MTKTRDRRGLDRLLEIDVTPWLAVALLVVCVIGGFFGAWAALKTVVIGFVLLLILSVPVLLWSHDRSEYVRFGELRDRFGGEVTRDWHRFGRHRLSFTHREATVVAWLNYPGRQSFCPTYLHVEMHGCLPPIEFEIVPRGIQSFAKRFLGKNVVNNVPERFNADYGVFGEPALQVCQRLTEQVQEDVRSLATLGLTHVTLNDGRLDVVALDESLKEVVQLTLDIYDELSTE